MFMIFCSRTLFYFNWLIFHFLRETIVRKLLTEIEYSRHYAGLCREVPALKSIIFIGDRNNSIIPNLLGFIKIERANRKRESDLIWIDRDCNKEITIDQELWICRENIDQTAKTKECLICHYHFVQPDPNLCSVTILWQSINK